LVENYAPIAWAEELIEPARAVDHPRLAALYALASQCYATGRIEAAVGYAAAGELVIASGRYEVPFDFEAALGVPYVVIGQPERCVELCRAQLPRGRDTHVNTRTVLTVALELAGCGEEARATANGLIDAAEATHNPWSRSQALLAYGAAFHDADPDRARDALRRGLVIAQDSGNRNSESLLAAAVSHVEAEYGDPLAALDYILLVIRNYHDAGNTTLILNPLAVLAALFDRLGRYEPAATIAGFAVNPFTAPQINTPIAHLREVLGDQTHESLAHKGETMTTAAMATYAYDQIDQSRAALNAVLE
jgi:tetratricopeptide (TPR) repeat protein